MKSDPEKSYNILQPHDVTALIIAPEDYDTTVIREFFSSNNVMTTTVYNMNIPISYLCIFGTLKFVKEYIESHNLNAEKSVAMIFDENKNNSSIIFKYNIQKIVLIGTENLSSRIVSEIFGFMVESREKYLLLRDENIYNKVTRTKLNIDNNNFNLNTISNKTSIDETEKLDRQLEERYTNKSLTTKDKLLKNKYVELNKKYYLEENKSLPQNFIKLIKRILYLSTSIVFLYLITLVISFSSLFIGFKLISSGKNNFGSEFISFSTNYFSFAKNSVTSIGPVAQMIGADDLIRSQEILFSLGVSLGNIGSSLSDIQSSALILGNNAISSLFDSSSNKQQVTSVQEVNKIRNEVSYLDVRISRIFSELELLQKNKILTSNNFIKNILSELSNKIYNLRQKIIKTDSILSMYPYVAGFDGTKKILILLQNNSELRPTGGFIGSVGVVDIQNGNITNFNIQDVYVYDGQLKGHVDPPKQISDILKQEHWYLRDSNWDPDFKLSAQKAIWFYENITGEKIDGVIGVTMDLILDILNITGPIDLPDYKDTITSDNFFTKSLFYTKTDFFPGSTQKKDFLGSVTNEITGKLIKLNNRQKADLINNLVDSLDKRDIQMYFTNENLNILATSNKWSGASPIVSSCVFSITNKECFLDYFRLVDANLGVNKVNYYIKNNAILNIIAGVDGKIKYDLLIKYKNNSEQSSPGGGVYANYLRFYVPKDANIESITIDNVPIESKQVVGEFGYIYSEDLISSNGLQSKGINFIVNPLEEKNVNIKYSRLINSNNSKFFYELYIQKQAGHKQFPFDINIVTPRNWKIIDYTNNIVDLSAKSQVIANNNSNSYNTTLEKDLNLGLDITK